MLLLKTSSSNHKVFRIHDFLPISVHSLRVTFKGAALAIKPKKFHKDDFHRFRQFMSVEIEELRNSILSNKGLNQSNSYGAELEAWITEKDYKATPKNEWMLKELSDKKFVPELSKYNLEYNSDIYSGSSLNLSGFEKELADAERSLNSHADKMESKILLIGSLPSLELKDMQLHAMTAKERYFTLNEQILDLESTKRMNFSIAGEKESLEFTTNNIMPVAASTSFQMHYQMPYEEFISSYNASLYASAILVAVSANSPYLFGKELWEESRIPLFEQSINSQNYKTPRVGMGFGFLKEDICEYFCQSQDEYDILFPESEDFKEGKFHLNRLHNGTVWHWNRVIVEAEPGFQARIEFRPCSSGPTAVDMAAHFAFYLGLVKSFSKCHIPSLVSFKKVHKNFYETAKKGYKADVYNFHGGKVNVQKLIRDELLDLSLLGLKDLGVPREEASYYINSILRPRVEKGVNGASWQRAFVEKYGKDFNALLDSYWLQQRANLALKDWKL